jgi:Cys-tRNA synthase (O-phospho-L-seryl-tRNA:Cys-tRNA synthase)
MTGRCTILGLLLLAYIANAAEYPYIEERMTQWGRKVQKEKHNDLQNIHIKLKIEQHEPGVNTGAPEW